MVSTNPVDISDIPSDYVNVWQLGKETFQKAASEELHNALKAHFVKMQTDEDYRKTCHEERDALFWEVDVNKNEMLDEDEYLVFCKKMGENLTKKIGVEFINVDEETMRKTWNLNRWEGKIGITLADFHKKQDIDKKLMQWRTA